MEQIDKSRVNQKIGLIGGLAHRAGIFYYERLLEQHTSTDSVLELTLSHANVQHVLACVVRNDKIELGRYIAALANELFDGGAKLVAITAIAPHFAIAEAAKSVRGPIIDALTLINPALAEAKLERVAIFGNRAVMQTNIFGSVPEQSVVKLLPHVLEEVHLIYTDIALRGKRGTQPELDRLEEIAGQLISQDGAQAILLAGTDLSAFYSDRQPSYAFLDIAQLHIKEIMRCAKSLD